eukprot:scaffold280480_cov71-Attheya_sp.AAC.1
MTTSAVVVLYLPKFPVIVPQKACSSLVDEKLQLMPMDETHKVIMEYSKEKFSKAQRCIFQEIGQLLYNYALATNQAPFTVQIGGMDRISNDAMYDMFVRNNSKEEAITLKNWIPVIVEPGVPNNFESLTKNYADIQKKTNLTFPLLSNWAVSYKPNAECMFCQFDVSDSSNQVCKDYPDWAKYQLATLECEFFSKKYYGKHFELCIIHVGNKAGGYQSGRPMPIIPRSRSHDSIKVTRISQGNRMPRTHLAPI